MRHIPENTEHAKYYCFVFFLPILTVVITSNYFDQISSIFADRFTYYLTSRIHKQKSKENQVYKCMRHKNVFLI